MAMMTDSMRLTPDEAKQLNQLRMREECEYQRWVQSQKRQGRKNFPLVPYHMSWAFEEEFRRSIQK